MNLQDEIAQIASKLRGLSETKEMMGIADRLDVIAPAMPRMPFDVRCANAMADAIDFMVRTKLIDSRSPAADALLSYRDGKPTSEHSDQLVALEKLLAELGTVRNELKRTLDVCADRNRTINGLNRMVGDANDQILALHKERIAALDVKDAEIAQERAAKDGAYRERNQLAVAFAHMALDRAYDGEQWGAGVGRHQPDPDPTWDPQWLTVLFIDTPAGQLSWHLHDTDKPLLEGLPKYTKPWDGHSTVEKYDRIEKLFKFTKVAS